MRTAQTSVSTTAVKLVDQGGKSNYLITVKAQSCQQIQQQSFTHTSS
jgi:hypothetical protein